MLVSGKCRGNRMTFLLLIFIFFSFSLFLLSFFLAGWLTIRVIFFSFFHFFFFVFFFFFFQADDTGDFSKTVSAIAQEF